MENVVVNELTSKPVSMRGISATNAWVTNGGDWIYVIINEKKYGLKVTSYENYVGDGYSNGAFPVWILQILLNHYGAGLNVDSTFGPQTKAAIKRFQDTHSGLSKDYVCGPATWRALANNF
ncbi:MAG: peptidoglycan-binding protein [Clostridium sp.]|nr:peptidoglycan-binding protein [Clostridium sp.]